MNRILLLIPTVLISYISMTCSHVPTHFRHMQPAPKEHITYDSLDLQGPVKAEVLPEQELPAPSESVDSEQDYRLLFPAPSNTVQLPELQMHNVPLPEYTRGIYLTNNSSRTRERLEQFIKDAQKYNINTFVMDVQSKMVPAEYVELVKKAGIFPVARIVIFEGGLKTKDVAGDYVQAVLDTMTAAANQGFQEIQLDYIRYADRKELEKLPLSYKYSVINSILKRANEKAQLLNVYLSADVFGRITLNQNDHIGQKLENFAKYMDTIYPMVYPSHYTNDDYRISHPYHTVQEGVANSVKRCKGTRIVAYIQGFYMKVKNSGLSLTSYIHAQMKASSDAKGHGWIVWNAKNQYKETYEAIQLLDNQSPMSSPVLSQEKIPHEHATGAKEIALPETLKKDQTTQAEAIPIPGQKNTSEQAAVPGKIEKEEIPGDLKTPEPAASGQEPGEL